VLPHHQLAPAAEQMRQTLRASHQSSFAPSWIWRGAFACVVTRPNAGDVTFPLGLANWTRFSALSASTRNCSCARPGQMLEQRQVDVLYTVVPDVVERRADVPEGERRRLTEDARVEPAVDSVLCRAGQSPAGPVVVRACHWVEDACLGQLV
jgi:hypothetical protein